eukprot:scaffold803_cov310-Pinguiococcus_pyrenoidosus.AAC.12
MANWQGSKLRLAAVATFGRRSLCVFLEYAYLDRSGPPLLVSAARWRSVCTPWERPAAARFGPPWTRQPLGDFLIRVGLEQH